MRGVRFIMPIVGIAAGFGLGMLVARPHPASLPSDAQIARAQQMGDRLRPPAWQAWIQNDASLRTMRRRGYIYCRRDGRIDAECAREQDDAVGYIHLALLISNAQRKVTDDSSLSPREREVVRNPALRSEALRYCSRLYADHGSADARLPAACLGNLSEFSLLVGVPPE